MDGGQLKIQAQKNLELLIVRMSTGFRKHNTYWYRNTNYVRLKNIQLGYTLPTTMISKVGLKTARLYVNAINLVTWDSFKVFDPETDNQDGTVYPQKKTFNVGVNLILLTLTVYEKYH